MCYTLFLHSMLQNSVKWCNKYNPKQFFLCVPYKQGWGICIIFFFIFHAAKAQYNDVISTTPSNFFSGTEFQCQCSSCTEFLCTWSNFWYWIPLFMFCWYQIPMYIENYIKTEFRMLDCIIYASFSKPENSATTPLLFVLWSMYVGSHLPPSLCLPLHWCLAAIAYCCTLLQPI